MELEGKPALAESVAAALDWWREAGVDGDWLDAPASWLAPPEPLPAEKTPAKAVSRTPPPPPPAEQPLELPGELAAFREWWLTEPRLDGGRIANRVPPHGQAGAKVMLLVPEPEREDADSLLCGPRGRLLQAMLAAMGIAPDAVYFASVLPRHTPHADWAAAARAGIGDVLARHVVLAAPQRLIAFGGSILPLFGNDPAQSGAVSLRFEREGVNIPMLAARDIAALLERPRWKAGFWRDWLAWMDEADSPQG